MFLPLLLAILLLFLGAAGCHTSPKQVELTGRTMGTTYSIQIVPDGDTLDTAQLQSAIDSILLDINRQMSTYVKDSEITRFNQFHARDAFPVSDGFFQVVRRALFWSRKTNGAFDITVLPLMEVWGFGPQQPFPPGLESLPPESVVQDALAHVGYTKLHASNRQLMKDDPGLKIDLGAIAKGYGVDAVFEYLETQGLDRVMVEIGGEVRARGKNSRGQFWRIGVKNPVYDLSPNGNYQWIYNLRDQAVATSGDYHNFFKIGGTVYSHEIDPRTGYPVQSDTASATVVAPTCTDADSLATALMVMDAEEGLEIIESLPNVEAFLILRNGKDGFEFVKSSGMMLTEQ